MFLVLQAAMLQTLLASGVSRGINRRLVVGNIVQFCLAMRKEVVSLWDRTWRQGPEDDGQPLEHGLGVNHYLSKWFLNPSDGDDGEAR